MAVDRYQWSVVSCQLPVISCQLSVISFQLSVIGELGGLGGNCIKRAIKRNYQAR